MKGPLRFVYTGPLYNLNKENALTGRLKARMCQSALYQFGCRPPQIRVNVPARVKVIRVLGPRQRKLDEDKNLGNLAGPVIDALVQGGWLRDDSPQWAHFEWAQDPTRRWDGPKLEITITYVQIGDQLLPP